MSISKEERKAMKMVRAKYPMAPLLRAYDKVGRNDPCPCGSGKKWKKCCKDSKE
jgi:preprotein translocase subunit SecA